MPTDKPRTMITFTDKELHEKVNTYRFEHRYKSQNEAIMVLIDKGIESLLGETHASQAHELSPEEKRMLIAYRNAEDSAKRYALQMLENNPIKEKANLA